MIKAPVYLGRVKVGSKVALNNGFYWGGIVDETVYTVQEILLDIVVDVDGDYERSSDIWLRLEDHRIVPYYHVHTVTNTDD